MARKEAQEKELKTILQKDIVTKNPILTADHVTELFWLFNHYADPRQKRADVRDLLLTAKTLGLDTKYQFVAKMLEDIHEATEGNALDFEQFLKEITNKIGNPFNDEGRKANFTLLDMQNKGQLDLADLRFISDQLKYGYDDDQLREIIRSVGGYNSDTISYEKFRTFVERRVNRRKA